MPVTKTNIHRPGGRRHIMKDQGVRPKGQGTQCSTCNPNYHSVINGACASVYG